MLGIRLSAMSSQCLDHRNPDPKAICAEVATRHQHTNRHRTRIDWHFTIKDAPITVKCFNPNLRWFAPPSHRR